MEEGYLLRLIWETRMEEVGRGFHLPPHPFPSSSQDTCTVTPLVKY